MHVHEIMPCAKADLRIVGIKHSIIQQNLGICFVRTKVHGQRRASPHFLFALNQEALTPPKPSWLKLPLGIAISCMLNLHWRKQSSVISDSLTFGRL